MVIWSRYERYLTVSKTIRIELDNKSINQAIKELRKYKSWIETKETELRTRLAELGVSVASIAFSSATYDGDNDVSVTFTDDETTATITASGKAVAFIEFGSGAMYGYGHPQAGEFGFGPGTWSDGPDGKGHWADPNGWYYEHGKKSHGNPPAMAMVKARDEITANITRIAREVFSA